MRRVLFGDFGGVVRAGFDEVLRDGPVEVLGTEGRDLLDRLVDALPDVVVLDLERVGTAELVDRLVRQFPAVKVVVCSTRTPLMRVYPPFHYGESYEGELEPGEFLTALQA